MNDRAVFMAEKPNIKDADSALTRLQNAIRTGSVDRITDTIDGMTLAEARGVLRLLSFHGKIA